MDTKYLKYSANLVNRLVYLSGNLANISGCTKLKMLGFVNYLYKNISGSLSDISQLTELTTLKLR